MIRGFTVDQIIQSFDNKKIEEAVADVKQEIYYDYHVALEKVAKQLQTAEGALLAVLSDACSMMFTRDGKVFGSYFQLPNGLRSASIEDFKGELLEILLGVYDKIGDPVLKSRISDILWVNRKIHKAEMPNRFAQCALDGYLAFDISYDSWYAGRNEEVWSRAISLAKSLGVCGVEYVNKIEQKLMSAFLTCQLGEKSLMLRIGRVMLESDLSVKYPERITAKLEERLSQLQEAKDILEANDCYDLLIGWYEKLGNRTGKNRALFGKAEANRQAGNQGMDEKIDPGVLSARYEEAQRCYDELPRNFKSEHGVAKLAREVRKSLRETYKGMSASMHLIRSKDIDISKYIAASRKSMHGLDLSSALCRLVGLHAVKVEDLKAQVRKLLGEQSILGIFPLESFDGDRLVAKMDGVDLRDPGAENTKRFLFNLMRQYEIHLNLTWRACLWPSFCVLREEHNLEDSDYYEIVCQSRFVPENRRLMFARGLKAGFCKDFQTAAALLIPQIENSVRKLLQAHGADTAVRVKEMDNEVGLSKLVEKEDLRLLFDEDLGFEMRAMFGSVPCFDLRNRYAHGMVDDCKGYGMLDFMVWHLCLKLVIFGCMEHPEKCGLKLPES